MRRQAEIDGIPADWMDAARRSPVYALAMRHRVALPLHPEYRTLPMVWYVPPLSPVMGMIEGEGSNADPDDVFPAIDRLRIPVRYLSNLLAAGDDEVDPPRAQAARRDAPLHARAGARRRGRRVGRRPRSAWRSATWRTCTGCWRSPSTTSASSSRAAHAELAGALSAQQGACGLDFAGGPGGCGANGRATRAEEAVEAFHLAPRTRRRPSRSPAPSPGPEAACGEGCGGAGTAPAIPARRAP